MLMRAADQGASLYISEWLDAFMRSPLLVTAIFIGNSVGAVAGLLYWYGDQLRTNPWWFWPFIPDSPLSTFWIVPALALILWQRPGWPLLNAYAAFGIMKYGLWTVIFWVLYWRNGGSPHLESITMSATHLVMLGEGVMLLNFTRMTPKIALILGTWFLFNDWLDFGPLQLRPGLPVGVSVTMMLGVTVELTVLLTGVYLFLWLRSSLKRRDSASGVPSDRMNK